MCHSLLSRRNSKIGNGILYFITILTNYVQGRGVARVTSFPSNEGVTVTLISDSGLILQNF